MQIIHPIKRISIEQDMVIGMIHMFIYVHVITGNLVGIKGVFVRLDLYLSLISNLRCLNE